MKEFIKIKKQELFISELLQEIKKTCNHLHGGVVVHFTIKLDEWLNYDSFAITKIEKGQCNYHNLIKQGFKNDYCTFIGPIYYKDKEYIEGYETDFILEFI